MTPADILNTLHQYGAITQRELQDGCKLLLHIADTTASQDNRKVRTPKALQRKLLADNSEVYTRWMFTHYYNL